MRTVHANEYVQRKAVEQQMRLTEQQSSMTSGVEDRVQYADSDVRSVLPTSATHTVLAQLKAGEKVYQTGERPKTF